MTRCLPRLSTGRDDSVQWLPSGNNQFTVASAKESIRIHGDRVNWCDIVWFKGHVPRFAFILWMVCKGKLLTGDKLKRWGCIQEDNCVLCDVGVEDIQHLFLLVIS